MAQEGGRRATYFESLEKEEPCGRLIATFDSLIFIHFGSLCVSQNLDWGGFKDLVQRPN